MRQKFLQKFSPQLTPHVTHLHNMAQITPFIPFFSFHLSTKYGDHFPPYSSPWWRVGSHCWRRKRRHVCPVRAGRNFPRPRRAPPGKTGAAAGATLPARGASWKVAASCCAATGRGAGIGSLFETPS